MKHEPYYTINLDEIVQCLLPFETFIYQSSGRGRSCARLRLDLDQTMQQDPPLWKLRDQNSGTRSCERSFLYIYNNDDNNNDTILFIYTIYIVSGDAQWCKVSCLSVGNISCPRPINWCSRVKHVRCQDRRS